MKKEFVFSAKFDTSEFDRSVEEMQRKMKSMHSSADMTRMQNETARRMQQSGVGGMTPQSMEAYQRATQSARRELDNLISEQAKGQEKLGKFIAQRAESIKQLVNEQKKLVQGSKEELELREKIQRTEANQQALKDQYRTRDAMLNKALDARDDMRAQKAAADRSRGLAIQERLQREKAEQEARAERQRGFPDALRDRNEGGWGLVGRFARSGMYGAAGRQAFGMMGGWGGVGSALGTVGLIGERGSEALRDFRMAPVRTESAMGSAVQGTLGRQVSDIYGRRSAFEQMFAPERQRAAQQSVETLRANQSADQTSTGFGLLKSMGIGAAGGGAIGGLFGGVGAIPGALIGGTLGLGKGVMDIMGDERKRSMALSPFSSTANKRYQSILAEEMVKNYETSYEGQKNQNPFKTGAVNDYEQNFQRNLASQRAMGLNNEGFYGPGGFMQNAINSGFTPEMSMQMSSGILGAGGSTRMARDSAFGMQLERGMDLTNASQVLGSLSGGLGSSESSKQATIKILAEGMKLGLDDSKFAEENRRFTQLTAEIVARSGATTDSDFERVAGGFGKFLGENTNMGIAAAKGAYEQFQDVSQATTGPRGVMRAAGFMSDPNLSKLSTMTKQALMQVPEEQLNEDNPLVQNAAREAGISAKDIVASVKGTNQGAVSRFKDTDVLRDRIRGYAKGIGKENLNEEDIKNAPESIRNDFNQMLSLQAVEFGYKDSRQAKAFGLGTVNQGVTDPNKALGRENVIMDKMGSVDRTGRMEDSTIKAMAADSKVVLDNFNEMAPAMKTAAETTAAWTREVREASAAMQQALEAARQNKNANTLKTVEEIMKNMANPGRVQQQSGKTQN